MAENLVFISILGFIIGTLSGMFGIGGALIAKPFLRVFTSLPGHMIIGTPLPMVIPTAGAALIIYIKKKYVNYEVAATVGLSGMVTAAIGAFTTNLFTGQQMMYITALFLVFAGLFIKFRKRIGIKEFNINNRVLLVGIGLVVGLLSGFMGVGGGFLLVPLYISFLKMDTHRAFGTSLMTIMFLAVPGIIAHFFLGNIDVTLFLLLSLFSVVGAIVGSKLIVKLDEARATRWVMSVFIVLGVLLFLYEVWGKTFIAGMV